MAFNYGFPATYQPMMPQMQPQYQQPQPQPQMPQIQQQNQQTGITWVQGEAAAKSYLVAPGCTVQLWDSEEKVIYLKSADASGMPSMKILDYTIRGEEQKPQVEYATRDELRALEEKIREIAGKRRKMAMTEDENNE